MADDAIPQVRAPETIYITVLRARNLKGSKGDVVNATVKLEFGEKQLGESGKIECTQETPGEFNFSGNINFTFDDPHQYDDLLSKPVLLTLTEVLPKEKKQKEEKTVVLGQCAFDLLPLVEGEAKFKYSLPLFPVSGSPLESIPADQPRPEVDIQISVAESLLSDYQREECNLMTITMESLYAPPDSWSPSGAQNIYTVCLPLPASADRESCIVFPNGVLKMASDKDVTNKQKKWLTPGAATGGATYMPDSFLSEDNIEDEDGDLKAKEDREHRQAAEQEKNRVIWNSDRRCYLESGACRSLKEKIAKNRYLPVEVMRITTGGGKGKDESGVGFHGVVFVDVAPLLYPGVKRIRGCYRVVPYTDDELVSKTGRKTDLSDECLKITNSILLRTGTSPFPKKGDKGGDKKEKEKDAKKATAKTGDSGSEADGQAPVNVEGQQYLDAKSYIMLEMKLTKPLVPKRPPEELAKLVSEYIPPRPLVPKRTNSAEKAVEDFHSQIGSVASLVLDEFRNLYGKEIAESKMSGTPQDIQSRRQKLIYELNASGKYFAFKEQLKYTVVKIVREKYMKTTKFQDPNELQAFLSELYVFLVDQMHVGMSKVLSLEDQSPVPQAVTDAEQLKHFAREAEVNENYEWASKYYQERIARDKDSAEHWIDYGVFSLYLNDLTKAEECFKECIAIDPRHLSGLMLYGIVSSMQERHEVAETFFEAATCVAPDDITAWTLLGLFYDSVSNDIQAEMAFMEANKKNLAEAKAIAAQIAEEIRRQEEEKRQDVVAQVATGDTEQEQVPESEIDGEQNLAVVDEKSRTESPKSPKPPAGKPPPEKKPSIVSKKAPGQRAKSTESMASIRPGSKAKLLADAHGQALEEEVPETTEDVPIPSKTIFMHAVEFLLEVKAMACTERALAHELVDPNGGPTLNYQLAHAKLKLQKKEFDDAEMSLRRVIEEEYENAEAWSLMGHLKYLTGDTMAAKDCYERTVSFINQPGEMHPVYLRLASIYLHEGRYQDAKHTFLYACKKSPSCVSWLGVGISCYRLDELSEAEDALAEANMLNNYDPEVWAYLSLVCLKTGRQVEAEQSYKYAVKLNLQDEDLMNELHQLQLAVGFGDPQL